MSKTIVTKTITTEVVDASGKVISTTTDTTYMPVPEVKATAVAKPVQTNLFSSQSNAKTDPPKQPVQTNLFSSIKLNNDAPLWASSGWNSNGWGSGGDWSGSSYSFESFGKPEPPKLTLDRNTPEYRVKMLKQIRLLNELMTKTKARLPKNIESKGIQASNHNASLSYDCTFEINGLTYAVHAGDPWGVGHSTTYIDVSISKDSMLQFIVSQLDIELIRSLRLTRLNDKQANDIGRFEANCKAIEEYHIPFRSARGEYIPYTNIAFRYDSYGALIDHIMNEAEDAERQKLYNALYPKDDVIRQVSVFDDITNFRRDVHEPHWGTQPNGPLLSKSYPILFLYLNRLEPIPESILNRKELSYEITSLVPQIAKDRNGKERNIAVLKSYKVE